MGRKLKLKIPLFIREDISYKLLALLLATIIWLFVHQQIDRETAIYEEPPTISHFEELPLRILLDPGVASRLKPEETPEILVAVKGPRNRVDQLTAEQIRSFVDLTDVDKPGKYERPVQVWLPHQALTAEQVYPQAVTIQLEVIEQISP